MIVDEMKTLSVPERFFAYAHAYREAADTMCRKMASDKTAYSWPNAAVVLMLAAHAVELFLKGAILFRKPNADVGHHDLDSLGIAYSQTYPEGEYSWDIPFKTEYLGICEQEIAALKKEQPVPSILYRYPINKAGNEWEGLYGFIPDTFGHLLERLGSDMSKIERLLLGT